MTEQGTRAVSAAAQLREALEQTAAALASPRLETLLAGEAAIEDALSAMPALDELPADERLVVRRELERARGALLRCRRLGHVTARLHPHQFRSAGPRRRLRSAAVGGNRYAGQR